MIGLVCTLVGPLGLDVYETVSFTSLDSLEAIDVERIAEFIRDVESPVPSLAVRCSTEITGPRYRSDCRGRNQVAIDDVAPSWVFRGWAVRAVFSVTQW